MTLTKEHCRIVAAWLRAGGGKIGNEKMKYDQSTIDCGYACCAGGALSLASGRGHADFDTFHLIVREELPALGRCYRVAAALCDSTDDRVGPVLAALLDGDWTGAVEASKSTQMPDGSGVWFEGVCEGQAGGDAYLYGSSESHGMTDGYAWLFDSAQSHGMTGGAAVLRGSAQSHGMAGGTLYVLSPDAKVIDRKGGLVIWHKWDGEKWVETRREGTP